MRKLLVVAGIVAIALPASSGAQGQGALGQAVRRPPPPTGPAPRLPDGAIDLNGVWVGGSSSADIAAGLKPGETLPLLPSAIAIMESRKGRESDDKTLTSYFNHAAFAQPAPGTLGDHLRNAVTGPNYWNVDLAVSRLIAVAGTQRLELRLESFNLFNHFNWGNPVANFNAGTFGRITTRPGPRASCSSGSSTISSSWR